MIELIKKAMFTGIGVASLTKEKVEEVAKVFVEQGKLSEQEGKKLVDEIMEKSKESQEELTKKVEAIVQAYLNKLDIGKASEINELKTQMVELKAKIEALQQQQQQES